MKKIISTNTAPKAIGAYSQACQIGNQLFISGQIGLNPNTGELVSSDIKAQLEQAILNMQAICIAANTSLQNIVKLNVYLIDMKDFPIVNELVTQYFEPHFPARAVVQVSGLPKNAMVEIDGIAFN